MFYRQPRCGACRGVGAGLVQRLCKVCRPTAEKNGDGIKVTVKHGDKILTENTDYTVEIKRSEENSEDYIVTVSGKGNYKGIVSVRYEIESFDHATWIIPTATVTALGIAFGVLMLLKYLRKKRGGSDPDGDASNKEEDIPSEAPAESEENITEEAPAEDASPTENSPE